MTLFECFDFSPLENVIAGLRLKPDRIIFLGNKKPIDTEIKRYQKIFKKHHFSPEIPTQEKDKDKSIVDILKEFIKPNEEIVIDITGGDEETIFSIATAVANLDDNLKENVSVQRFNLNYYAEDCDNDGEYFKGERANVTVEELIELYGGKIHPKAEQPDENCSPETITPLWNTMISNPKDWNNMVSALNDFESGIYGDTIRFSLSEKRTHVKNFDIEKERFKDLRIKLKMNGIITDNSGPDRINYTYKNSFFHDCVKKQGNILELKVLLEARRIKENNKPFFNDCQMSVTIDWDGITYGVPNTKNEIDVILMRDATPVFISCKNGDVKEDELYKLSEVADRFGGEFVKKVLVVTDNDCKEGFVERAKDMGIHLHQNARKFETKDWENMFREIF
jgi:hypothetical protein